MKINSLHSVKCCLKIVCILSWLIKGKRTLILSWVKIEVENELAIFAKSFASLAVKYSTARHAKKNAKGATKPNGLALYLEIHACYG